MPSNSKEYSKRYYREHYLEQAQYREDHREEQACWRANNRNRINDHNFRRRYGITLQDYGEMLVVQSGRCAICHKTPEEAKNKRALSVDHNHVTSAVRGLLCNTCNMAVDLVERVGYEAIETYMKKGLL
jgi:hypothetical protein